MTESMAPNDLDANPDAGLDPIPDTGQPTVEYLGIRHHSPACARSVAAAIERLSPAYVLIEGPADMNDRLDELLLGHELPIAIFSHHHDDRSHLASWSPLCEYSPEWVALERGTESGAAVRFIDLPAWHSAFAARANRYSDGDRRYAEAIAALCESLSIDGMDRLWDHLFEGSVPVADLTARLATFFERIREQTEAGPADTAREAYMARWVAAAVRHADGRPVLVVTGGFHTAAIRYSVAALLGEEDEVDEQDKDDADGGDGSGGAGDRSAGGWPDVPVPAEAAIHGSFLVPYSFRRLDSFTGYESGMPSPGYHQAVWDDGPEEAIDTTLNAIAQRLRSRRQPVSVADLIAARTLADGLARLRGHSHPLRTDLLDGLAAALVKHALDAPLPWTRRGPLRPGTDPLLVEIVAVLSGDREGRLHPATPQPPLVADVITQLEEADIELGLSGGLPDGAPPLELSIDLTKTMDVKVGRLLHRLRVLGIPGIERRSGPNVVTDAELTETWLLTRNDSQLSALIEAGAYGATLAEATAARLGQRLSDARADLAALAAVLVDTGFVGLAALSLRVVQAIEPLIDRAADVRELGSVLVVALALVRQGDLLGDTAADALMPVLAGGVSRALWLIEGIRGGARPADERLLSAVRAVRDVVRRVGSQLADADFGFDPAAAIGVMARQSTRPDVPPDLRGAAFGYLWSMGELAGGDAGSDVAGPDVAGLPLERVLRQVNRPAELGDWLAGLFALARDEVLDGLETDGQRSDGDNYPPRSLLAMLDRVLRSMDAHEFLIGLPALRLAFGYFPPQERERIAAKVLGLHSMDAGAVHSMTRTALDPEIVAAGRIAELWVDERIERYGLGPIENPEQDSGGDSVQDQEVGRD